MRLVAFSSLPAILDSTKIAPHQSYTGYLEKNETLWVAQKHHVNLCHSKTIKNMSEYKVLYFNAYIW